MKSSMCSSLSDDEEHEINVESGSDDYEEENDDLDEDMCNTGTDNETDIPGNISVSSASSSPSSTLPFSISRLLSADKDIVNGHNYENSQRLQNSEATSLYSNSTVFSSSKPTNATESVIYSATGGVIKVPAHRPNTNSSINGPTLHQSPALGSPFPWLAMDPTVIMQRNAAAAMLASHVAKERLTGNYFLNCS